MASLPLFQAVQAGNYAEKPGTEAIGSHHPSFHGNYPIAVGALDSCLAMFTMKRSIALWTQQTAWLTGGHFLFLPLLLCLLLSLVKGCIGCRTKSRTENHSYEKAANGKS